MSLNQSPKPQDPTNLKVLVVEDDRNFRKKVENAVRAFNSFSKDQNNPFRLEVKCFEESFVHEQVEAFVLENSTAAAKKPVTLLLDNAWNGADQARVDSVGQLDLEAIEDVPDSDCPGSLRLLRSLKRRGRLQNIATTIYSSSDYSVLNQHFMEEFGVADCIKKEPGGESKNGLGNVILSAYRRWYQRRILEEEIGKLVGNSQAIERLKSNLRVVCQSISGNVLLVGEAGVGKSLVAGILGKAFSIGRAMARTNVSGLSDNLIESELFGHMPKAFTGAPNVRKYGLFEIANGGALVMEEVGDLPPPTQAKVLIAVDPKLGGYIHPVGATKEERVFVRLVSSTNRNLPRMVEKGEFREDLWQRLGYPHVIRIPTLQERAEDFEFIVEALLQEAQDREGYWWMQITDEAMGYLRQQFVSSDRQARLLGSCVEIAMAIAGNGNSRNIEQSHCVSAVRQLENRLFKAELRSRLRPIDFSTGPVDLKNKRNAELSAVQQWLFESWDLLLESCENDRTEAIRLASGIANPSAAERRTVREFVRQHIDDKRNGTSSNQT